MREIGYHIVFLFTRRGCSIYRIPGIGYHLNNFPEKVQSDAGSNDHNHACKKSQVEHQEDYRNDSPGYGSVRESLNQPPVFIKILTDKLILPILRIVCRFPCHIIFSRLVKLRKIYNKYTPSEIKILSGKKLILSLRYDI